MPREYYLQCTVVKVENLNELHKIFYVRITFNVKRRLHSLCTPAKPEQSAAQTATDLPIFHRHCAGECNVNATLKTGVASVDYRTTHDQREMKFESEVIVFTPI